MKYAGLTFLKSSTTTGVIAKNGFFTGCEGTVESLKDPVPI